MFLTYHTAGALMILIVLSCHIAFHRLIRRILQINTPLMNPLESVVNNVPYILSDRRAIKLKNLSLEHFLISEIGNRCTGVLISWCSNYKLGKSRQKRHKRQ